MDWKRAPVVVHLRLQLFNDSALDCPGNYLMQLWSLLGNAMPQHQIFPGHALPRVWTVSRKSNAAANEFALKSIASVLDFVRNSNASASDFVRKSTDSAAYSVWKLDASVLAWKYALLPSPKILLGSSLVQVWILRGIWIL